MSNDTKSALKSLFCIYATLDVIWAALIATFASIVLSQGLSVTGAGTASTAIGGIGGWLLAFAGGLFQGAIFLVVFSVFGALIIGGAAYVSKNDPKLRHFLEKLGVTYLVVDLIWAFVASTFYSNLLFHLGNVVGAGAGATKLGAAVAWIITFIAAAAQGAIFLVVFSVFALVALVIGSLLFGGKKS